MGRILKYVLIDIARNRTVLLYTMLLGMLAWSSFALEDNTSKGMLTVLNLVLLTVPLVSIFFATIYIYNSGEFIELLLSHPLKRSRIWFGLFLGLNISLIGAYFIGVGLPLLLFVEPGLAITTIIMGCLLTATFVSMAMLCSLFSRDKSRGIGYAILLWLYFALLFDGLVLFILFQFSDYPVEKFMVGLTCLSPVDLTRIFILLKLDSSALMGYTGAIFRDTFGSGGGMLGSFILLLSWVMLPFYFSLRKFNRKDL